MSPIDDTAASPRLLSRADLAEFRDLWIHQDSSIFAASIDELMAWDEQLHQAISNDELDGRASWEIEEDARAQRIASIVLEQLGASPTATLTRSDVQVSVAGPTPTSIPDLVRATDVGMKRREWRSAIKRGELRASKVGREYMATRADYERYLAARRVEPTGTKRAKRTKQKNGTQASSLIDRAFASGKLQAVPPRGRH